VAERFADDVNDAYLRPALKEANYPDADNTVIAYDDNQVVIPPDRTEDADKALDRAAIGWEGYRELKGIPEDMAPSEEEQQLLISMKLRMPVDIDGGEMMIPQRGPVASQNGSSPEDGPPNPNGGREGSRQEARTASILGASSLALMRCRELADNKKAEDIVVLDVRKVSSITDYFVVATGTSEPHLRAIVDEITENLEKKHDLRPRARDGALETAWVVLDYFDVIVHVMRAEVRQHYNLEDLWGDAPRVRKTKKKAPPTDGLNRTE
jgi:ribosome-associated protein